MDELLLEDIQLESMEILSLEERGVDEVIRENLHSLLDAELDIEEILYESVIVLESGGDKKSLIRRMLDKIKEFIRKIKNWVNSIIKRKKKNEKEQTKNTNTPEEKQTVEEKDYREYNKAILSETIFMTIIDTKKVAEEFKRIMKVIEQIANTNKLFLPYNEYDIDQMLLSIKDIPDFKSFKIEKAFNFQSEEFTSGTKLSFSPCSVRVPENNYFAMEIIEFKCGIIEGPTINIVERKLSFILENAEEDPYLMDCIQKCTTIFAHIVKDMADILKIITDQEIELKSAVRSREAELRKKYNV